jgi:site-specific DNA-cytosine methylase
LTVAERKRLQGVPDNYHICGPVEDVSQIVVLDLEAVRRPKQKDRQVGNMINVNLSRALHGHIHREVFFKAWLEMGKPLNFLERWRELHPI